MQRRQRQEESRTPRRPAGASHMLARLARATNRAALRRLASRAAARPGRCPLLSVVLLVRLSPALLGGGRCSAAAGAARGLSSCAPGLSGLRPAPLGRRRLLLFRGGGCVVSTGGGGGGGRRRLLGLVLSLLPPRALHACGLTQLGEGRAAGKQVQGGAAESWRRLGGAGGAGHMLESRRSGAECPVAGREGVACALQVCGARNGLAQETRLLDRPALIERSVHLCQITWHARTRCPARQQRAPTRYDCSTLPGRAA